MRIKRICYPVEVLGPGKRVGIWVVGCKKQCPGCIAPELRDPQAGRVLSPEKILEAIRQIEGPIDGVTISGGEPFDQPQELLQTVRLLCETVTSDIIIYTGYTLEELRNRKDGVSDQILAHIAVLIDGPYIDALNTGKGLFGSSNQTVHIFRDEQRYAYMRDCDRKLQMFEYSRDFSLVIGIM